MRHGYEPQICCWRDCNQKEWKGANQRKSMGGRQVFFTSSLTIISSSKWVESL